MTFAHLQSGNVAVGARDAVITGQPVGLVGNSGNTREPYLHLHAVRAGLENILEGEGAPLLFEERFPVRNTLLNPL